MGDILSKLGSRIREERKKVGLTQEKLAECVELSTDYIGYIERGKQAPYLKTLEKIAAALGIEVYELFIFRGVQQGDEHKTALHELTILLHDKSTEDIEFVTLILKQIFEKTKKKVHNNNSQ